MKASRVNGRSLILVVLLMAALLAACTATPAPAPKPAPAPAAPAPAAKPAPAPAPAAPAPAAKPAPAPAPKPVAAKPTGTLRVGLQTFYLERFGIESGAGTDSVNGVYEWLITVDKNGRASPMLAERWEQSPDAKTWTFYLRKGVQFQDGWGEFTAEDVKFTIEQGAKKGSVNTTVGNWTKQLDRVDVVNPYQIAFRFKQPFLSMLNEANAYVNRVPMVSKKYYTAVGDEQANRRPIGTGPYKLVDHAMGDTIKLQAVPNHWRLTPGFEFIVYKLVSESASMLQMMKAGDIDVSSVEPADIDQLKAAKFSIAGSPASFAIYVGLGGQMPQAAYPKQFDPKIPWVGDPSNPASLANALKVRQALALGVDKEAIIRNLFRGAGSLITVPYYFPGDPWTDPGWKPIPYDPAQAKKLLAEAGYPNGLEFTFWSLTQTSLPELPKVPEAIAMQWQQIGVKANLKVMEGGLYKSSVLAKRNAGYAAFSLGITRSDTEPLAQYNIYFYNKAARYYGVEDPRLDQLQSKIVAEPDPVKRAALQKQRGQLMMDNTWIIPVGYRDLVYAASPKVAKWAPLSMGTLPTGLEYAIPAK